MHSIGVITIAVSLFDHKFNSEQDLPHRKRIVKEFIDNFKQLSSLSVQRIHKQDLEKSRESIASRSYIPNLKPLNL